MKLWLDDYYAAPDGWLAVTTVIDAIDALATNTVTDASLDHDLGFTDPDTNGMAVCQWMKTNDAWPTLALTVHTRNRFASTRMCELIDRNGPYVESVGRTFLRYPWGVLVDEHGWAPHPRPTRALERRPRRVLR